MNIFKIFKLYRTYKKTIKSKRVDLSANFNIRIDRANRLYTVLNIPEEFFSEPYNTRTADINVIAEKYIKEYIGKLSTYLNDNGLSEMYDFYEPIKKIDKYSFLIVLGFKYLNSVEYNNLLWLRIVPITAAISFLGLLLYLIFG
jgi:hypothetical protein